MGCNTVEYISASKNGYEMPVWKSLASMNIRRFDFGLSMYGDKLAAYGGQPTIDSEKIEVYCPDTNTWKLLGRSLVNPERHFFATMCVPESKFPETPGYVTEYVKPTTYKPTYAPTEYVKPTYKPTYAPTEYVKPTYKTTYAPTEYVHPTTTTMEHVEEEPYATLLIGGCYHNVGVKDTELYPPNIDSSNVPPTPLTTCTKSAGAYYNGSLILCGGGTDDAGTPCYQYEIGPRSSYEANEWEPFCALNVHRCRFTMTVVESCNALVVVGGFKSGADIEIYKDGKWRDGPEIDEVHGLIHHCSVSYGDSEVMIIGGFCDGKPTSTVLSVDIRTDEVTKLPSLTRRRYSHACAKSSWNKEEFIVVAGGFSDFSVCNTVEYISASKNGYETPVWKSLASMNIRRFDFGLSMYGDKLAAYGGQPTIDSEKIEVYCPDTNTWKLLGRSLVHPERHFFATMCVPESKFPETPGYVTEYVKPTTYKPTYAPTEYVKPTYKPTYAPTEC